MKKHLDTQAEGRYAELSDRVADIMDADIDQLADRLQSLHHFLESVLTTNDLGRTSTTTVDGRCAVSSIASSEYLYTDPLRTYLYWNHLRDSVVDYYRNGGKPPFRLIYPGSGARGTLALAMATMLSPRDFQVTFIDIHKDSTDHLKELWSRLGLGEYIEACFSKDVLAENGCDDLRGKYSAAILEVIDCGLMNEAQVAIVRKVRPLIEDGGYIIPSGVSVSLTFETADRAERLETPFFRLDGSQIQSGLDGFYFDSSSLCVSAEFSVPFPFVQRVIIYTEIHFGSQNRLSENDALITTPLPFDAPSCRLPAVYEVSYRLGERDADPEISFKAGKSRLYEQS